MHPIYGYTKIDGKVKAVDSDEIKKLAKKYNGLVVSKNIEVAKEMISY